MLNLQRPRSLTFDSTNQHFVNASPVQRQDFELMMSSTSLKDKVSEKGSEEEAGSPISEILADQIS